MNYFIKVRNEHKFLFLSAIISSFLGIIPMLYCFITFNWENKFIGLVFLLPVVVVYFIAFYSCKIFNCFPNLAKILSFVSNISIILFIQLIIGFFTLCLFSMLDADKVYDNPKYYKKALESISWQEKVLHFPTEIPHIARNAELYKSSSHFFGSESIILKFNADKDYIDSILKQYNYISVESPENYKHKFNMISTNNGRIDISGFTFYVINDIENENLLGNHFPYHYGIGVNFNSNQIIFYYTLSD